MALVSAALAASLQSSWLLPGAGSYADSAAASGDRFAGAATGWFAAATAGAFPCTTATARRGQLASTAGNALAAGSAQAAGAALATALAGYLAGQVFGAGVASMPLGITAASTALAAAFGDVNLAAAQRADQIAQAVYLLALTTVVVFPPVVGPPAVVS